LWGGVGGECFQKGHSIAIALLYPWIWKARDGDVEQGTDGPHRNI